MKAGIHGSVGGPVSENDGVAGESDGESGEDGGVGWLERVIPLCPYVPNSSFKDCRKKRSSGWLTATADLSRPALGDKIGLTHRLP